MCRYTDLINARSEQTLLALRNILLLIGGDVKDLKVSHSDCL